MPTNNADGTVRDEGDGHPNSFFLVTQCLDKNSIQFIACPQQRDFDLPSNQGTGIALGPKSSTLLAAGHVIYNMRRMATIRGVLAVTVAFFNEANGQGQAIVLYPKSETDFVSKLNDRHGLSFFLNAHSYEDVIHPGFKDITVESSPVFPTNVPDIGLLHIDTSLDLVNNITDPITMSAVVQGIANLKQINISRFTPRQGNVRDRIYIDGGQTDVPGISNIDVTPTKPVKRASMRLFGSYTGLFLEHFEQGLCPPEVSGRDCSAYLLGLNLGDSGGAVYRYDPDPRRRASSPIDLFGLYNGYQLWRNHPTCSPEGLIHLQQEPVHFQNYLKNIAFCESPARERVVVAAWIARVDGGALWNGESMRDWILSHQK